MKNKIIIASIALVLIIGVLAYMAYGYYQKETLKVQNPIVTMEIEDFGTVKMELYPQNAPNTVRNFIKLINEEYYNGLTFHRVEESLIQGGDKAGNGTGSTEYTIEGEFSANGHKENTLSFTEGTLGLARKDYTMYYYYTRDPKYLTLGYNTGCDQFFITAQDCSEEYDGYFCAFGKVIEGLDIVKTLTTLETTTETNEETGETTSTKTPVNPPIIRKMTVDTFGVKYNEPKMITE